MLVCGCSSYELMAQGRNPVRIELNANLDMESYNLVPCGEKGLLVFFEDEAKGSEIDTKIWHFAFYNKNLKQKWLADTALITGVKFKGFSSDDENTYLLFVDVDKQKSSYNLQILKVDYEINEFSLINAIASEKADPVHFSIHNNNAVIAFNNSRLAPFVQIIELSTSSTKEVRPEIEGLNIIQELIIDEEEEEVFAVVENYLGKKQNAILILQMDVEGHIEKTYRINPAIEKKVINEARIAHSDGDTILIMGTYSNYASKVANNDEETSIESAGYFITRFEGDQQIFINYYNFLEFEEMYRALSSKAIADLRKKAEKQKEKGDEYSLDYTLLLHDVVLYNGNYVLLSEAYYPEYRTVTNMYYDYYGRPIPQTYTVFDG